MATNKLYTGIVLDEESLKIARIKVDKSGATLIKLDQVKLVEALDKSPDVPELRTDEFDPFSEDLEDDSIFGMDEDEDEDLGELDLDSALQNDDEDLDLDFEMDLDDMEGGDEMGGLDMADESGEGPPASNELLFYNLLSAIDPKKIKLTLNNPSGATIYQILKDVDFSETKKKDLKIIIDDRLESIYGAPKTKDFYSYTIRDDGALFLASVDGEAQTLQLMNRAETLYKGNVVIDDIIPDEILLIGLLRSNYELASDTITAIIQFAENSCRILFLKGKELWIVSPMIEEGTRNPKFLNTVFSKILFQLDTGEVPNLDQIIFCNNDIGDKAVSFFQERFPDIEVSNFNFDPEKFDTGDFEPSVVSSFTTAIAASWTSAEYEIDNFPKISFLPSYVKDRQKIFKLQWHGFLILALILAMFPITNYLYQQNSAQIKSLESERNILKAEITALQPTVNEFNRINSELSSIQSQLELLSDLSKNTLTWSTNLDIINKGINNIDSIWLTFLSVDERSKVVQVQGYSLYRNRIPMIADIFVNAVLIDVSRAQLRDKEIYSFQYEVSKFVPNNEMYTPESAKGLNEILGDQ